MSEMVKVPWRRGPSRRNFAAAARCFSVAPAALPDQMSSASENFLNCARLSTNEKSRTAPGASTCPSFGACIVGIAEVPGLDEDGIRSVVGRSRYAYIVFCSIAGTPDDDAPSLRRRKQAKLKIARQSVDISLVADYLAGKTHRRALGF